MRACTCLKQVFSVLVAIGIFLACGCSRNNSQEPTASEIHAMEQTFVGAFEEAPPNPNKPEDYYPRPKDDLIWMTLSSDRTFHAEHFGSDLLSNQTGAKKKVNLDGVWHAGDDGDGSWALFFEIKRVDGAPSSDKLLARISGLYNSRSFSFDFRNVHKAEIEMIIKK